MAFLERWVVFRVPLVEGEGDLYVYIYERESLALLCMRDAEREGRMTFTSPPTLLPICPKFQTFSFPSGNTFIHHFLAACYFLQYSREPPRAPLDHHSPVPAFSRYYSGSNKTSHIKSLAPPRLGLFPENSARVVGSDVRLYDGPCLVLVALSESFGCGWTAEVSLGRGMGEVHVILADLGAWSEKLRSNRG